MYFFLSSATKKLIIRNLRAYWSTHPEYQDLVDNIQGKYSFEERPQYGIIVKTGSASKVQLSPDNFIGVQQSHVTLAKIPGYPGSSVEWVREDGIAIEQNGALFPSEPGIYYCSVEEGPQLFIDPLLEVRNEPLSMVTNAEAVLQQVPYPGSLRLFEQPSGKLLRPETDYTIGEDGVTILLRTPIVRGISIVVDYRYPGTATGPWDIETLKGYNKPIPGCVLVFGRKLQVGDRFAVLVSRKREDACLEYGGRWEVSVDIDIIARDVESQMEIADQTAMYLWANLRPNVVDQGVDISDVTMSGESEEVYDENGDDYFYNSTLSMTMQTDWFLFEPILPRILSYDETVATLPPELTLAGFRDPFFTTKFAYPTVA